MKKLYRKGGAVVHPSPPNPVVRDHHLSFLPATILTLTAALSPEDKEVLAYLVSCSIDDNSSPCRKNNARYKPAAAASHPPSFNCDCFGCYTSYWARWDSSPKRQLIHDIIDAYEEGLMAQSKKGKGKKDRRRRGSRGSSNSSGPDELKGSESRTNELGDSGAMEETNNYGNEEGEEEEEEFEKGSMRRFLSFLEERIWSVFGHE